MFAVFILSYYIIGLSFLSIYLILSSIQILGGNRGPDDTWGGIQLPDFDPPVIDGPTGKDFKVDLIDPEDCIDEQYKERVAA